MSAVSWVEGAAGSGFDVDHLPFGVFSHGDQEPRPGVRIGNQVLDLAQLGDVLPLGDPRLAPALRAPSLNPFLALGPSVWGSVRDRLVTVLTDPTSRAAVAPALIGLDRADLHLPIEVADYVDFYCSEQHATNVGRMFRPDGDALLPNWKHLPIGYHGRAGTVLPSGTPIRRPHGQRKPAAAAVPDFGPSRRLDIEAELGFVVGVPTALGSSVPTTAFTDHVFGVGLVNDWSARDLQAWEYVPLGPFLGKSFATSLATWITPLAALEAARVPLPEQDPKPLEYLQVAEPAGYDIGVEVVLNGEVVSRPPYSAMYWSPAQMLAHMTSNGASVRTGDLFASGTISGDARDQRGSFLELSWGGQEPFRAGGRDHTFLEDGDEVVLRASAPGTGGGRITLGEVLGTIRPAEVTPS